MLSEQVGMSVAEQLSRRVFMDFDEQDMAILRGLKPLVEAHADSIVDAFYQRVRGYDELMQIISQSGSSMERLKSAQRQYLLEIFDGDFGPEYVERRLKIGVVHNRIGLKPNWYLGSYSNYTSLIVPLIQNHYRFSRARATRAILAVTKALSFDAQLAIETYIHAVMQDLSDVSLSKGDMEAEMSRYREFISGVATGDLSQRLDADADISGLGAHLNTMTEGLASMSGQIFGATDTLSSTVAQMLEAVSTQSASANEQAAAVNQATSTLEEIRAISRQTQDKAEALGLSADRIREEGERGENAVERTVQGMDAIHEKVTGIAETILALSEQSQQIGEITDTVNGLAQQLKMLALNASIEAAKAGEAGTGFAVVATEVKDLAEQSQQATQQVRQILDDIRHATDKAVVVSEEGGRGVEQGMALVQQAGDAVRKLTGVIQESSVASQQIVVAVRQEATGIDQVTTAMSEISKATELFVQETRKTSESAASIRDVATSLQKGVSVYRV